MKRANHISIVFLCAFVVSLLLFYIQRPLLNFDLAGYVASVLMFEESDPLVIHKETFSILKENTPEHSYIRLAGLETDSANLNRLLGSDPEAFRQSLPFYRVRIAYTTGIYLLTKCGLEPVFASHAISAISVSIALFLLGFLYPGKPGIALRFLIPFVSLGFGAQELSRLSNPDGLGLLVWILFFFLMVRRNAFSILLLPALTLVRNDYVLMIAIISFFSFYFRFFDRRLIASACVLSLLLHFSINAFYGNYTFLTVLHYLKHFGEIAYPESVVSDVSLLDYFRLVGDALSKTLHPAFGRVFFLIVFSFAILFLLPLERAFKVRVFSVSFLISEVQCYSVAGLLYVFAHVFAFPYYDERFFTFIYLFIACAFFKGLMEAVANRSSHPNEFFQNSFRFHRNL